MKIIVSLVIFLVLFFWIWRIYFTEKKKFRYIEYNKGEYYLLSRNMYFAIFTVCTAPVFLDRLALLKYALWFALLLFLFFSNKIRMRVDSVVVSYLLFFIWLCFSATYSPTPRDAFMMLVKYALPLLFLYLGYSALSNEKDLIIFLKSVNLIACVYCFTMGGVSANYIAPLYIFSMGVFATYAPFADFLAVVFIVPIILYWLTKDRIYIYCALWMLLSTVLQSVRTGIGAMLLVFMFALLLRYKTKAIPGVLFAGVVFICIILFVPGVNEKFFGADAGTVTAADIVQGDALSMENIDTNGRNAIWEMILDRFYDGHEFRGSGLGVAIRFLKNQWMFEGGAGMIHNDYVQLLAETGFIGVGLLVLFYIVVIVVVTRNTVFRRSGYLVRLTGIMALSSMAGIAFCMYFDNVVSNSMQSLVIPYLYLGFYLKAVDLEHAEWEKQQNKIKYALQ